MRAIYGATLAELADVGYDRFTIEGVAQRARTGKASIYRRWSRKLDLIIDAVDGSLPSGDDPPETGSVRDDLLELLRRFRRALAGPMGQPMLALVSAMHREPELVHALHERVFDPRSDALRRILRRGVAQGVLSEDVLTSRLADIGNELVVFRYLTSAEPPRDDELVELVDDVLMPVLGAAAPAEVTELKQALADAHLELRRLRAATARDSDAQ